MCFMIIICDVYAITERDDCCCYSNACPFSFQRRSENPESRISYKHPGARQPLTQDVAVSTAVDEDICCVTPLPRDPPRRGRKSRYDYFVAVEHFQKR